jgi:S-formylglutathione hydrolase
MWWTNRRGISVRGARAQPANRVARTASCGILALAAAGLLSSQTVLAPHPGAVHRIKVHGKALEGNLEGDSADRDVSVYLPSSYDSDRSRRYPVIYMLHGFTDDDERWMGLRPHWINLPLVLDKASAAGGTRDMILVMPNAYTRFQGSMYSSSVTTGDWEEFVAKELVAYVDSHYRTFPQAASRGLAGHSMGGYGAIRIGMKYPEVFSSIYALSPCCLTPNMNMQQNPKAMERALAVRSFDDVEQADFGTKATLASAAAWSPNPKGPPLFLDLPWKDGQFQPLVAAKWAANSPLAMIDQYIPNVKQLHAIAFDAGDKDMGIAASIKVLDQILTVYGIQHTFEVYPGTHTSNVADRIEKQMMPYFSRNLSFGPVRR